jgi:hypothetical protein
VTEAGFIGAPQIAPANIISTTKQGGPSAQPLESGRFHSILHPTEGTATIFQMGDGTRVLRLASFSTSNGPDVHVYMVAADDAKDVATVPTRWIH